MYERWRTSGIGTEREGRGQFLVEPKDVRLGNDEDGSGSGRALLPFYGFHLVEIQEHLSPWT